VTELGNAFENKYCNLRSISLRGCEIGDLGFSKIYRFLKSKCIPNINLSNCDLSPVSMTMIIEALKSQFNRGQSQFWIENLRKSDQEIDQSKCAGIKTLKLNENSRLSDAVIPLLTAIIYDDLRSIERIE
jgi:hypothetical protein